MSRSIFSSLSLARRDGQIEISYPIALHGLTRAQRVAAAHGIDVRDGGAATWQLRHAADGNTYPEALKAFFAELNDLRRPYPRFESSRLAAGDPLVSCIVVVNENLPFFREQLLPSLAANSARTPIEVIAVCNGSGGGDEPLAGLRGLRSEWGTVSKAYNAGARIARGRYLAFFHDDCIVCDPLWIEKCLQRLRREAHAVAGEYRRMDEVAGLGIPALPIAQCVPLVIGRAEFEEAGGYDEYHYIGYEDFDFTLALASRGKKLVATNLDIVHFHGMSSTLKYNPVPGLAELYGLAAVPRFAVMDRFNEFWRTGADSERLKALKLAMDAQLLYVFRKHRAFLARIDGVAYARVEAALEQGIAKAWPDGPDAALARFREVDREAGEPRKGRG